MAERKGRTFLHELPTLQGKAKYSIQLWIHGLGAKAPFILIFIPRNVSHEGRYVFCYRLRSPIPRNVSEGTLRSATLRSI